ncbi:hypothetical protein N7532_003047 [Penicillium argentinense]|uniref:MFS transporter n=1 Tax=Penicillium argentinense TaxID=1131581 RepID=A0A9W9FLP4_9EURO|nr:uncharacterized protein N7532_003047 [Penicillium argentinense]KAJ5102518.1 hypothetical protein N7532_003047 [Penicillium argentinense]
MAPDHEFDREEREDAPFLSEPGTPVDAKPRHDQNNASAKKIGFRLKMILFTMILAVEVGLAFLEGPMVRILESIACRQYFAGVDPSKIGANGNVPEGQCKVAEVQAELAAVKGYHMFFDGLLSAAMAFPYGLLADRRGRKSTLALGIPGFAVNSMISLAVMWFSDIFPLRAIWLSSLGWLIGGGPVVSFAIIWTMMADVTTEAERAGIFFQFGIVSMGADFVSTAASSWLMALNPWVPLIIGFIIIFFGLLLVLVLPETKHAFTPQRSEPTNVELSELDGNDESKFRFDKPNDSDNEMHTRPSMDAHMSWSYPKTTSRVRAWWDKCRTNIRFYLRPYLFILNHKPVLLLLSVFLIYRLSRGSSWFLTQYISTRYHWTLAEANLLVAFRPTISIPMFLWGLPYLKKYYLNARHSSTQKDLSLARASILLFTLGTLGIGLSPAIATLIPSMVIQASGSGFVFLTRSIITTLVERDQTARLYTVIEILQSVGNVVASLTITAVFQLGLRLGGFWIGLAWMVTSSLFCMVAAAIWVFRLPPAPRNEEFVVGEFGDDE